MTQRFEDCLNRSRTLHPDTKIGKFNFSLAQKLLLASCLRNILETIRSYGDDPLLLGKVVNKGNYEYALFFCTFFPE